MSNIDHNFSYIYEKFADARRCLMLPSNYVEAIAYAFHECSLGLHQFEVDKIDSEHVRDCIKKLFVLMDTSDIEVHDERGVWRNKIDGFGENEKMQVAQIIDELASYFCMKFWEGK